MEDVFKNESHQVLFQAMMHLLESMVSLDEDGTYTDFWRSLWERRDMRSAIGLMGCMLSDDESVSSYLDEGVDRLQSYTRGSASCAFSQEEFGTILWRLYAMSKISSVLDSSIASMDQWKRDIVLESLAAAMTTFQEEISPAQIDFDVNLEYAKMKRRYGSN